MKNNKLGKNGFEQSKKFCLHYMETIADIARESFLILDPDFKVISGNLTFYKTFKVTPKQTVGFSLYSLGNGQWNIPELKKC